MEDRPGDGALDPGALDALLADGRCKLVCFPHCSNVMAEINDVAAICAMAHAAGARTVRGRGELCAARVPGRGGAGVRCLSVLGLQDLWAASGDHGVRARPSGCELPGQGHFFNHGTLYKRHTPAGPDHAQIAACCGDGGLYRRAGRAACRDRAEPAARNRAVHDLMRAQEVAVIQPLLDYLAARNDVRLIGPRDAARRAPTVAVELARPARAGVRGAGAARDRLLGGGNFYAVRPLTAMGVDLEKGVLRMGRALHPRGRGGAADRGAGPGAVTWLNGARAFA